MDVIEVLRKFKSNRKCYAYLEKLKWPDGPVCPHCGHRSSSGRKDGRHRCHGCNSSFSVLHGTIFSSSRLPLNKWFVAISLILGAKKGISSLQLSRHLRVNRKTAWYMQHRIRSAMRESHELLKGVIEADEAHVGGVLGNVHRHGRPKVGGGYAHMETVLGMLERKGRVVVVRLENGRSGEQIKPLLKEHVSSRGKVVTDGYGAYHGLSKMFKKHYVMMSSRSVRTYGRYHTNSIEGFWSLLKRAIAGQYHRLSSQHLQSYLDELCFKYNHRRNPDMFRSLFVNALSTPNAS